MQTNNPCELLTAAMPVGSGVLLGVIINGSLMYHGAVCVLLIICLIIQGRLILDCWTTLRKHSANLDKEQNKSENEKPDSVKKQLASQANNLLRGLLGYLRNQNGRLRVLLDKRWSRKRGIANKPRLAKFAPKLLKPLLWCLGFAHKSKDAAMTPNGSSQASPH